MLTEERRQRMMELAEIAPVLAAIGGAIGRGVAGLGKIGLKVGAGALKTVGGMARGVAKAARPMAKGLAKSAAKGAAAGAGFSLGQRAFKPREPKPQEQ